MATEEKQAYLKRVNELEVTCRQLEVDKEEIKISAEKVEKEKNDLVVMYNHFPHGSANMDVVPKMWETYNQSLCEISLTDAGHLKGSICAHKTQKLRRRALHLIHGFHHITNMDFYRSERTMRFLKALTGDYKFSRKFDDQIGVTLPAAMDAPNRSWDYRRNGLNFAMHHNGVIDGVQRDKNVIRDYHKFHWQINRKN